MRHIVYCTRAALAHPRIAFMGAREYRGTFGMSYEDGSMSESYDAGRELAHILTLRRYEA